jgi:hypothetical protein
MKKQHKMSKVEVFVRYTAAIIDIGGFIFYIFLMSRWSPWGHLREILVGTSLIFFSMYILLILPIGVNVALEGTRLGKIVFGDPPFSQYWEEKDKEKKDE